MKLHPTKYLGMLSAFALSLMIGLGAPVKADELDDVVKAGVLKVGIFEDFPPFASADINLKPQGYDIDVINLLAKGLNVKAELVGITGQNRIPYLVEHKVNLLVSVGKNPEREKVIAFTAAYAPYFIAVMGPKEVVVANAADLKGKSVAVNRGTLEDTSLTEVAPVGTDIKRFSDYNGVISAFLSGQVQLMVVGNDVGATVLAKNPAIKPEQKFQLLNSPSNLAVNKGQERFRAKIDELVATMKKDGTLDVISKKWLFQPIPADL